MTATLSSPLDVALLALDLGLSPGVLAVRRRLNPWIPANPTTFYPSTRTQYAVIRLCNVMNKAIPKSWSVPLDPRWQDTVTRRYEGMFRESNRRLAELTGIDLAALGYDY